MREESFWKLANYRRCESMIAELLIAAFVRLRPCIWKKGIPWTRVSLALLNTGCPWIAANTLASACWAARLTFGLESNERPKSLLKGSVACTQEFGSMADVTSPSASTACLIREAWITVKLVTSSLPKSPFHGFCIWSMSSVRFTFVKKGRRRSSTQMLWCREPENFLL